MVLNSPNKTDENYMETYIKLFLQAIKSKDYHQAFNCLLTIYNTDNEFYKNDFNFYLFLLSMITEMPEEYREYVKNFILKDVKIKSEDKRYQNAYLQNQVRILSLNQKFILAIKHLKELIKNKKWSTHDNIVKTLLIAAINEQERIKKDIILLATLKQYDQIVFYLEEIQKQHYLSSADNCILSLAKDIVMFKKTGVIPEIEITSTNQLFESIMSKNYELAFTISKGYIERNNISSNDNAIFMLLKEITKLIRYKKKLDEEESFYTIEEESDELEQDTLDTTTDSSLDNENNTDLDKIDDYEKNTKKEPNILNELQESMQSEESEVIYQDDSSKNQIETGAYELSKESSNNQLNNTKTDYDDYKLIISKLAKIHEKGVVILKPMDSKRRKNIHNIIRGIEGIGSFNIGTGSYRQVVIRLKSHIEEHMNFTEIAKECKAAYLSRDYDSCIEKYMNILKVGRPKSWIYAYIGLAYMKKFDIDTAIDYLTIATDLSKRQNTNYDFSQLLDSLKGLIDSEDVKRNVKMTSNDFEEGINNYYGIDNIDEVVDLISSGMSIDDVCTNLGMNEDKKSILCLILAREYYSQENYILGDKYLKKVEKTKNKSQLVKSLFEEIRKNKMFYKNRVQENHKSLIYVKKN